MSKIIVIGGIESTYKSAQLLYELGEDILCFYTRGENSPGWEGVDLVDESDYSFLEKTKKIIIQGQINDHIVEIEKLKPDFIWSLGWQQIYSSKFLSICPVIGIHESLLPEGAGPVPIANAILHDQEKTGVTLFQVNKGMDTGPIIGQLVSKTSPKTGNSTTLYEEAIDLGQKLITMYLPHLRNNSAPRISQDLTKRTVYSKINWNQWPLEKVSRARTYPYI